MGIRLDKHFLMKGKVGCGRMLNDRMISVCFSSELNLKPTVHQMTDKKVNE